MPPSTMAAAPLARYQYRPLSRHEDGCPHSVYWYPIFIPGHRCGVYSPSWLFAVLHRNHYPRIPLRLAHVTHGPASCVAEYDW